MNKMQMTSFSLALVAVFIGAVRCGAEQLTENEYITFYCNLSNDLHGTLPDRAKQILAKLEGVNPPDRFESIHSVMVGISRDTAKGVSLAGLAAAGLLLDSEAKESGLDEACG